MKANAVEAADEIDKISRNILMSSKAWGKLPTPIDQIVSFAELQIEKGVDLSTIEPGFLTSNFHFLSRALSKVVGLIDFRQKTIYLDHTQKVPRQNFVKLHEVGHKALPWQSHLLGFMDDEDTLDSEVKDLFEGQASYFASDTLFQLERFDDEAAKLPLSIKSPQALAQKFGGSNHAAIRRYVQRSKKRCAVLVLNPPIQNGTYAAKIRNYFQSPSFTAEFGKINWPDGSCGLEYVFVKDIKWGKKFHEGGQVALMSAAGQYVTFEYHFFNSTYNIFVLLMPSGEKIKSRTVILPG